MRPAFCHSWYRAICAFTVLLTACDGGGGGEPTGPSGPLTLQPARPEYATFESARVTVRGASLTSSSYPGTLGGTSIRAQRTSDSTVVFQVPELAAGTHTLSMQIGRRSATAQLAVRATPPIENPVAYIAEVDSLFLDEVEELEDWYAQADPTLGYFFLDPESYAADLAMMRATLADLRADFRALSPADQRKVAMTVQAFRGIDATASAGRFARSASADDEEEYFPQCQFPEVETLEDMRRCQRQHRGKMINRAKSVEQCNIDFDASWEEGRYADAVGRNYIAYQCMKARMLKLKRDVAETVRATVLGWFRGENTGNAGALALHKASVNAEVHPFVSGEPWPHFVPPVSFRNMHAEDIGRLAEATELGALMKEYQEGWDDLNEMFPRPFRQPPPWLHMLYQRNEVTLAFDPSMLSLGRIEPATVTGSAGIVDGEWALAFNGPHDPSDPTLPFSFELLFDNGELGADTLVVHATLLTHPLGGTWEARMSLYVREWRYRGEDTPLAYIEGPCTGDVELIGERAGYADTDTIRFGTDYGLACEEYDGITQLVHQADIPWVFDPGNPWLRDGSIETGSMEVDGQTVRVSRAFDGYWGFTSRANISATLVDGRMEGTYERVDEDESGNRVEVSGTFVAVRRH